VDGRKELYQAVYPRLKGRRKGQGRRASKWLAGWLKALRLLGVI
jgi:hypothetical protein